MKKIITENKAKKELIKIIKKAKLEEVIYMPQYLEGPLEDKLLCGSIITIKIAGVNNGKN